MLVTDAGTIEYVDVSPKVYWYDASESLLTDDVWSEWRYDSMKWRGVVLTGHHIHYCQEYDGLPVDETCPEWPCGCCQNGRCQIGV